MHIALSQNVKFYVRMRSLICMFCVRLFYHQSIGDLLKSNRRRLGSSRQHLACFDNTCYRRALFCLRNSNTDWLKIAVVLAHGHRDKNERNMFVIRPYQLGKYIAPIYRYIFGYTSSCERIN